MREKQPRIFNSPDTGGRGRSGEESPEQDLSPEDIERVMEKVQDVNRRGTAVTVLQNEWLVDEVLKEDNEAYAKKLAEVEMPVLQSTLESGLLGFSRKASGEFQHEGNISNLKKMWAEDVQSDKEGVIHANIVGRDIEDLSRAYFRGYGNTMGIVYNLRGFTENAPMYSDSKGDYQGVDRAKTHTFRARSKWPYRFPGGKERADGHPGKGAAWKYTEEEYKVDKVLREIGVFEASIDFKAMIEVVESEKDKLTVAGLDADKVIDEMKKVGSYEEFFGSPHADNGFIITHRVAPRNFDGVVYQDSALTSDKIREMTRVMEEVSKSTGKDSHLPIYDFKGNLHWPKQMSYEEVKKYVVEREAK